jgi:hypothetical protein
MDFDKFLRPSKYPVRKLFYDAVLLVLITFFLIWVAHFIQNNQHINRYLIPPEAVGIAIGAVLLFIFSIFIKWLLWQIRNYFFILSPWSRTHEFHFNSSYDESDLIYQGFPMIDTSGKITLTNSRAGVLIKRFWWKNLQLSFDFRFGELKEFVQKEIDPLTFKEIYIIYKYNFLGVIFRAQGLEDYFMVQIGILIKGEEYRNLNLQGKKLPIIITPHIRLNGQWEVFGRTLVDESIDPYDFVNVIVEVVNTKAVIKIGNFSYSWNLPTNFERGNVEKKENDQYSESTRIPFREEFGMVGFRAADAEYVELQNIVVKRI